MKPGTSEPPAAGALAASPVPAGHSFNASRAPPLICVAQGSPGPIRSFAPFQSLPFQSRWDQAGETAPVGSGQGASAPREQVRQDGK